MKPLTIALAIFFLGCSSPNQHKITRIYEEDYKTVFQSSLSALKDCKFTTKSYDWNSGEIDGYKLADIPKKNKIYANISIEQIQSKIKVRIRLTSEESSALSSRPEFRAIENQFFRFLDDAVKASESRH